MMIPSKINIVDNGVFIPAGEKHRHKGRVLTDKVKVIAVENA